jgi:glutathione S-transferase
MALYSDDGSILTEGVAIVQYLADLKPDRNLLAPTGSLTRFCRSTLTCVKSSPHSRATICGESEQAPGLQ